MNFWWIALIFAPIHLPFLITSYRKLAANKAVNFDDVRATGPLLEALYYNHTGMEQAATAALVQLLPRLRASDASVLTAAQRKLFRRSIKGWLERRRPDSYVLAALKALEQIGLRDDIPTVEALTRDPEPVASTAIACLELLRTRQSDEVARGRLLRPAMRDEPDANTLVRPAGAGSGTDPILLMRPVAPRDERDESTLEIIVLPK